MSDEHFASPPQFCIEQTSCRCGGNLAWMQRRVSGAWEMVGCCCHTTPLAATGVTLTADESTRRLS